MNKSFNYTPYIIKDMGRHNTDFVIEEYKKFEKYIQTEIK